MRQLIRKRFNRCYYVDCDRRIKKELLGFITVECITGEVLVTTPQHRHFFVEVKRMMMCPIYHLPPKVYKLLYMKFLHWPNTHTVTVTC